MNPAARPETVGESPYHASGVYMLAMTGKFDAIARLDAPDQQAVIAAVSQAGVTVPEWVPGSRRLPSEQYLVDSVERGASLADLYLLADRLDQDSPRMQLRKRAATTTEWTMLAFEGLAEGAVNLTNNIPVIGQVTKLASKLVTLPRVGMGGLAKRPVNRIVGVASAMTHEYYHADYYDRDELASVVWATLLDQLVAQGDAGEWHLAHVAQRFNNAFTSISRGYARRSLIAMNRAFEASGDPVKAALDFRETEREIRREERERERELLDQLASRESSQPAGAELDTLIKSADRYRERSWATYPQLEKGIDEAHAAINKGLPGSTEDLADYLSILLERTEQATGATQQACVNLFARSMRTIRPGVGPRGEGEYIRDHLRRWLARESTTITSGMAPVGMLRLAESMVSQPWVWGRLQPDEARNMRTAIQEAALEWYSISEDSHLYDLRIHNVIRTAYLNRRTELDGGQRPLGLAQQRARQLLGLLAGGSRRGQDAWVHAALPREVERQVQEARAVLKQRAPREAGRWALSRLVS